MAGAEEYVPASHHNSHQESEANKSLTQEQPDNQMKPQSDGPDAGRQPTKANSVTSEVELTAQTSQHGQQTTNEKPEATHSVASSERAPHQYKKHSEADYWGHQ